MLVIQWEKTILDIGTSFPGKLVSRHAIEEIKLDKGTGSSMSWHGKNSVKKTAICYWYDYMHTHIYVYICKPHVHCGLQNYRNNL